MLADVDWSLMYSDGKNPPLVKPDVKIVVNDVKSFEAHKLLLSVVSPKFRKEFEAVQEEVNTPSKKRRFEDSAYSSPGEDVHKNDDKDSSNGEIEDEHYADEIGDVNEESKSNVNIKSNQGTVHISGTNPAAVEVMLKFLYLGEEKIDVLPSVKVSDFVTLKEVFEVLIVANFFEVDKLREYCENLLITSVVLTEENIFAVLNLVDCIEKSNESLYRTLSDACRDFVVDNLNKHGAAFLQKLLSSPHYCREKFDVLCRKGARRAMSMPPPKLKDVKTGMDDGIDTADENPRKSCIVM